MSYCTTELIHVLHKSFIFVRLLEICIQGIVFITTDAQFASNHVSWQFPPLPFPQSHGHSVFLITTQSQTLSTSPEHQELNLLCRTSVKIYQSQFQGLSETHSKSGHTGYFHWSYFNTDLAKISSKPCRISLHNSINYMQLLLWYSDHYLPPSIVIINISHA